MSKLSGPLLSLGAHGTIADEITFQESKGVSTARRRPIPANPQTLPQLYHRLDYLRYCDQWKLLTPTQQAAYERNARPFNITGFNLFLRENLLTLPDIAGRWRMDERGGLVAADSGKHANTGVVTGALPAPGKIDYCRDFTAMFDIINCGDGVSLDITDQITMGGWANTSTPAAIMHLLGRDTGPLRNYLLITNASTFQPVIRIGGVSKFVNSTTIIIAGTWYHIIATYDGAFLRCYVNGVEDCAPLAVVGSLDNQDASFTIGNRAPLYDRRFTGKLDDIVLSNRAMTSAEVANFYARSLTLL